LAKTIGFSERLRGTFADGGDPRRDYHNLAVLGPLYPLQPDDVLHGCELADPAGPVNRRSGESWFFCGLHYTAFNQVLPPNAFLIDCGEALGEADVLSQSAVDGAISARSLHGGGVNVLMLDGGVQWAGSEIDIRIWRAMGTIAGGESW
jgi:prepilin-type processing-associated H-X9-DG protein